MEVDEYIEYPRCYTRNFRAVNYCWRCRLPLTPTIIKGKKKRKERN